MKESRDVIAHISHLIDQFSKGEYHQQDTSIEDTDSEVVAKLKALGDRLKEVDGSRRKVEEELLGSQEKLQMIVDNIDEIVYAIEFKNGNYESGNITHLSAQVEKVLGYTVEDFQKDNDLWYSLIHPQDIPKVTEDTRKIIEEKRGITRSYRLKHKITNEYVWFEDKVLPKLNEQNEVCGFYGGARDVTQRKLGEDAIQESESKYRSLFQHAPIGIAVTDKVGHVLDCNDTFLKQAGYQREDLKKVENAREFYFNPDDRRKFLNEFAESGKVDQWDVTLKRKDDSPYEAWLTVAPFVFEGKSCMMSLVEDITDRKLAEDRLRDSEARNKTIVENVQEAIFLFEPEKQGFVGFNQNALHMFGYSKEEFMNMTPLDISPPEQPDGTDSPTAIFKNVQHVMEGGHPVFEWVHRASDGRDFISEVHLTNIPYADRNVIMGSVVDISQRKAYEMERENLIQELDRFVYSASHDLSAPLKSILGLVNLIRAESKGDDIDIYLDNMEKSIGKLEKFIDDIIKYSRNSRLDVELEDIDMEHLVQEVLDNLKFADGFGSIKFKTDFKKLPTIKSDRFRLKIVLNNLISNSIKFRSTKDDSNPFIQIKGVLKDDRPVIEVHDNGQGIEEDVKDKIFEMFFRGAINATGSGLGLYIAKEAAENIDCQIQVESESSKGSVFSLVFNKNGDQNPKASSKKIRRRSVEV